MNISKLTSAKDEITSAKYEKARRGAIYEKLRLDWYFVYRKNWMEIKITKYVICQQEAF